MEVFYYSGDILYVCGKDLAFPLNFWLLFTLVVRRPPFSRSELWSANGAPWFFFFDYAFHAAKLVHLWKGFVKGRLVSGYSFCSLLPPLLVLISRFRSPGVFIFNIADRSFWLLQQSIHKTRGWLVSFVAERMKRYQRDFFCRENWSIGTSRTSEGLGETFVVPSDPCSDVVLRLPLSSLRLFLMLCSLAHAGGSTDDSSSCAIHP